MLDPQRRDLRLGRALLPRTPSTFRLLLLGDSMGLSQAVRPWEGTAVALEQRLNRLMLARNVEVINRSVNGFGFHHYAYLAQRHRGELQPDLIVILACANDAEVDYRVRGGTREEILEHCWGPQSPLVPHLRAAARRLATQITDTPILLFGLVFEEQVDQVLRSVAAEVGWTYATLLGRLGNLPRERIWATPTDGHPNAYTHGVIANEMCLALSQTIPKIVQRAGDDPTGWLPEVLERLCRLAPESGDFYHELLRVFDAVTQKSVQLARGVLADNTAETRDALTAVRRELITTTNAYLDLLGQLRTMRGSEARFGSGTSFPPQVFQHVKLLNAQVINTLVEHHESDAEGVLPWVDTGATPPPDQVRVQVARLRNARQSLGSAREQYATLMRTPAHEASEHLPPVLHNAIKQLQQRLALLAADAQSRARRRQQDALALIDETERLVAQVLEQWQRHGERDTSAARAVARSVQDVVAFLDLLQGPGLDFPNLPGFPTGRTFWQPSEHQGIETTPMLGFELEIETPADDTVGLWLESFTPHCFCVDYQGIGSEHRTYHFTVPLSLEFSVKLAGSRPFTVRAARLRVQPAGRRIPLPTWQRLMPNFWCCPEVITIDPGQLVLREETHVNRSASGTTPARPEPCAV